MLSVQVATDPKGVAWDRRKKLGGCFASSHIAYVQFHQIPSFLN